MKEPKIRFKGFCGKWEENKFSHMVYSISSGKDTPSKGNFPLYGSTGIIGTVCSPSHSGPLLLVARVGANAGHIQLVDEECGITDNTLMVCPKAETLLDYLYYFFQQLNLNKLVYGSGQPLITGGMLKNIDVRVGSKDECQLLTIYFQHLDSLIQSTTKKIESLKRMKAASLQSMFPQEGETKPRVRFKGFEGDWEKISLGKETYPAGIKNHDNLPLESYSISNEYGFIPQNVQFENGGTMATADKRMYYIVSKNSFGYNPARINVGSLGYYTGDDDVIVSSLYEIFKTSDRICDSFLLYWFKTYTFQKLIEQYQEGGVRFYFFYDKLCMCHTLIPSYEEQQKIASYFTNLDSQITLQTQRLEKLKQIKSACLNNMFV